MVHEIKAKEKYVERELYDVVCRSQSWAHLDMIIGGIDALLVETILYSLGETAITFNAAYASFKNRKIRQKLSIDDALLFWRIRNMMFEQYDLLKEAFDIDTVEQNIRNSTIPGLTVAAKSLLVRYFKAIAKALPYQEKQDEIPEWFLEYIHEFREMKVKNQYIAERNVNK